MTPLDAETQKKFLAAWRSSRRLAVDFADFLNRAGLLLTPARRRELVAKELRKAALELENAPAQQLIWEYYGSTSMTALDMQRAIAAWLRVKADRMEEEG